MYKIVFLCKSNVFHGIDDQWYIYHIFTFFIYNYYNILSDDALRSIQALLIYTDIQYSTYTKLFLIEHIRINFCKLSLYFNSIFLNFNKLV